LHTQGGLESASYTKEYILIKSETLDYEALPALKGLTVLSDTIKF